MALGMVSLARSVSEGDHETTVRQNDRAGGNVREFKVSPIFGSQGAIVVPLADASG
jgi:hypothetical protein